MKIVFMGTADFGVPTLEALRMNGYPPMSIVTAPDKPAGRGKKITFSPIKNYALENNIPLLQPDRLKDQGFIQSLTSLGADLYIVVAFRILPPEVFKIPLQGAFNLHASLLPKYRGAAPIQWAIINGDSETGVTTFFLDEKVDTGNVIIQESLPIGEEETTGEIHDKLAALGAKVVLKTVKLIEGNNAHPLPQDNSAATPAPKIFKEDCRIYWAKSANAIHNFIRGLSPRPCAYTFHNEIQIKIYRSKIARNLSPKSPGEIIRIESSLYVSTGDGVLEILELQQEGKKVLPAAEFLRGYGFRKGDKFS